jgi:hypothetical protein
MGTPSFRIIQALQLGILCYGGRTLKSFRDSKIHDSTAINPTIDGRLFTESKYLNGHNKMMHLSKIIYEYANIYIKYQLNQCNL